MEQIERIHQMELCLEQASSAVMQLSAALSQYAEAMDAIDALGKYYGSEEWRKDFADDEAGLLPTELKRGVLSEDGIWNVLSDSRELNIRMLEIVTEIMKKQ